MQDGAPVPLFADLTGRLQHVNGLLIEGAALPAAGSDARSALDLIVQARCVEDGLWPALESAAGAAVGRAGGADGAGAPAAGRRLLAEQQSGQLLSQLLNDVGQYAAQILRLQALEAQRSMNNQIRAMVGLPPQGGSAGALQATAATNATQAALAATVLSTLSNALQRSSAAATSSSASFGLPWLSLFTSGGSQAGQAAPDTLWSNLLGALAGGSASSPSASPLLGFFSSLGGGDAAQPAASQSVQDGMRSVAQQWQARVAGLLNATLGSEGDLSSFLGDALSSMASDPASDPAALASAFANATLSARRRLLHAAGVHDVAARFHALRRARDAFAAAAAEHAAGRRRLAQTGEDGAPAIVVHMAPGEVQVVLTGQAVVEQTLALLRDAVAMAVYAPPPGGEYFGPSLLPNLFDDVPILFEDEEAEPGEAEAPAWWEEQAGGGGGGDGWEGGVEEQLAGLLQGELAQEGPAASAQATPAQAGEAGGAESGTQPADQPDAEVIARRRLSAAAAAPAPARAGKGRGGHRRPGHKHGHRARGGDAPGAGARRLRSTLEGSSVPVVSEDLADDAFLSEAVVADDWELEDDYYNEDTDDWWTVDDVAAQAAGDTAVVVGLLAQLSADQLAALTTALQAGDAREQQGVAALPAFAIFGQTRAGPEGLANATAAGADASAAPATRLAELLLLPLASSANTPVPHSVTEGGRAVRVELRWLVTGVCLALAGLVVWLWALAAAARRRRGELLLTGEDSYQHMPGVGLRSPTATASAWDKAAEAIAQKEAQAAGEPVPKKLSNLPA
eukprot:scaffold4.g4999.t1